MGKLVRMLTQDGGVLCCAADTTDIAARAEQIHKTSAVVTAALGRLLSAASMMGVFLKGEKDSLTLRLAGNGPAGTLIAVSDSSGNVRGCPSQAVVELPLNAAGKLDVGGAVGHEGMLYVIRDTGMREPYIGQTPIVSGEIAEDITHYYAISEQIPTVCALGVLVNPDLTVKAAGGFLAQLLPGADEASIASLEENLRRMRPVSALISDGASPADIARMVLQGMQPDIVDESPIAYRCDCTRQRMERALISLGREELHSMAQSQPFTEVSCHFCGKKQRFTPQELRALAQ